MTEALQNAEGTPAPEVEVVTTTRIACDGGCGPLGHPRVWLTIAPEKGWIDCGYCDKRFVLKGTPAAGAAEAAPDWEPAPAVPPHPAPEAER